MYATKLGYATSTYEDYYEKIISMTLQDVNKAQILQDYPINYKQGLRDIRWYYTESPNEDPKKEKWLMRIYEDCKKIYKGSIFEFQDYDVDAENYYYYVMEKQNSEMVKYMKKQQFPKLGLVKSFGHVGGFVCTSPQAVPLIFNTEPTERLKKIICDVAGCQKSPKVFDTKDIQTNTIAENSGCQTLVFMFAAPFLNPFQLDEVNIKQIERSMNYNEYILDGLAMFAQAVIGVTYYPPPHPGYDRRVLSDIILKRYPTLLRLNVI